jgi:hypothetical protein
VGSSLGSAHFSELSLLDLRYAFYILLPTDRSKMRLVPKAVLSENDFKYHGDVRVRGGVRTSLVL